MNCTCQILECSGEGKKKKEKKKLFVSLNMAFVAAGLGEPASEEL